MQCHETIWVLLSLGAKQLGSVYGRLEVPLPMGVRQECFFTRHSRWRVSHNGVEEVVGQGGLY